MITKPIQFSDPQLTFTVSVEPEDMSPEGHFASGDDDHDADMVREILGSLNSGNEYAWCYVRVVATYTDPVTGDECTGEDSLGAVSCLHDDARDMSAAKCFEELIGPDGNDMRANALAALNAERERATQIKPVRCCTTQAKSDINGNTYVTGRHVTTGRRARQYWDHSLSAQENHAALATRLLGARPATYSSVSGGGYIFTVDPARCAD